MGSSEEKKDCVLRLFDQDVQVANEVIRSSEEKLKCLQIELELSRAAAGATSSGRSGVEESPELLTTPRGEDESAGTVQAKVAAKKLRAAIASATAALEALEVGAKRREGEGRADDTSPDSPRVKM